MKNCLLRFGMLLLLLSAWACSGSTAKKPTSVEGAPTANPDKPPTPPKLPAKPPSGAPGK